MADVIHADIAYSFRKIKLVINEVAPDNRALAAIEQLTSRAGVDEGSDPLDQLYDVAVWRNAC